MHLKSSQCDGDWHIQGFVDDARHRFDQRHEEEWEPDDADE